MAVVDYTPSPSAPRRRSVTDTVIATALTSVAAASVHFAVGVPHASEDPLFAAALVGCGALQLVWGHALLKRPTRSVIVLGLLLNVLALLTYGVSRSVGLPFGPEPWIPAGIGPLDLITVVDEAFIVFLAARFFRRDQPAAGWHDGRVLIGAAMTAAVITVLLLGAGAEHAH